MEAIDKGSFLFLSYFFQLCLPDFPPPVFLHVSTHSKIQYAVRAAFLGKMSDCVNSWVSLMNHQ